MILFSMPIEHAIDPDLRLVRSRDWGQVTYADLVASRLQIGKNPVFHSDFRQLYDFREVTNLVMTREEIRDLARHSPFGPGSRRAIVVPENAIHGLAQIFVLLHEMGGGGEEFQVFRSLPDAKVWLDLDGAT